MAASASVTLQNLSSQAKAFTNLNPRESASPGLRAVAQLVNLALLVSVITTLAMVGAASGLMTCLLLLGPVLALQWVLLGLRAQDLGKLVVGLAVVDHRTGQAPRWWRTVLLRSVVGKLLPVLIPVVGWLFAFADTATVYRNDHRCWHDRLAGTRVVRIRRTLRLGDWALAQVGAFLAVLGQFLLLGAPAMARREFHWGAFVSGTLAMVFYGGVTGALVFAGPLPLSEARTLGLWLGCGAACFFAGFVVGGLSRRVGFWEVYLAVLVTAGLAALHLAVGFDRLVGVGPRDTETYVDLLSSIPPGVRYLGPMWDRLLILATIFGLALALVGSSTAQVVLGDTERFDGHTRFEWFVASRHLAGRAGLVSLTAVVAVAGVSLGVSALVAVTAVMSGYQEDIQAKILSTNAHLVIQKYGVDFTEYAKKSEEALEVPGVLAATPFTFNEAMLSTEDVGVGVMIKGVVPAEAGQVTAVESNLCEPNVKTCEPLPSQPTPRLPQALAPHQGMPALVVGAELFKKIRQPLGSVVNLTTPIGIAGARGNAPKRMRFRLGGVFRSGMHEFDARLAYMELGASQQLMGLGNAVTGVEFRVADPENVEVLERMVLTRIGRYPYRTLDWRELNEGIFTALKLQKIVMFLVLCFIVVVASFNIASTLFMAVVEKAHEIAVLKSMGARDGSILKIFMFQGWTVGGLGTLIGCALGLLVARLLSQLEIPIAADVYMVESLQVRIEPFEVGLVVFAALIISHLASVYPALKAARQAPIESLRYDEV